MYKLYAQNILSGWKLIKTSDDLDEIELEGEKINPKQYAEYLIVEHTEKGDRTVRRQELYKEIPVEYLDDVKVTFEVKVTTFKPSKMKQKQELRKEIDKYKE